MKNTTQRLLAGLLMTALISSCSRPVAYFQNSPHERFATAPATPAPVVSTETGVSAMPIAAGYESAQPANVQIARATTALDQMDVLVRNDSKLAADKTVQKRLNRIRTLLAAKSSVTPSAMNAPRKAGLMEKLMLKKMNKKINRQLAPKNPNRAMANTGVLAAGAVLVIVGLILLIAGSSGTLGVILLLAGAVVLVVGLL